MNEFINTIDKATSEIENIQKLFKKSSASLVRAKDEKEILKAIALTWFHTHRNPIVSSLSENIIQHIDSSYQEILVLADKAPLRQKCQNLFKKVRADLHKIRNENITLVSQSVSKTLDTVPSFSNIVADVDMQNILVSRWQECIKCVENEAPLAATVMMGGLLETLLLSKINKLTNPTPVYTAKLAPKNQTGQTLHLKEWGLRNYIEVAHELKWISQTEKDLGSVLMDYRNYIHPFKQMAYKVFLTPSDAIMLWELCKSISKQLL